MRLKFYEGDNPLTAIYVARECGIVEPDQTVLLGVVSSCPTNPDLKGLEWKNMEPLKQKRNGGGNLLRRVSSIINIQKFSKIIQNDNL